MKTRKRDDGMLDVIDDAGTVVAIVDEKVLKHLAESNTLARAMFERGHSIGSRMVNVSLEQCEARRGKPVPGPTGWLWCSHCGGHMVPPGQPNARCKKCK
jgi:hypothetical protein